MVCFGGLAPASGLAPARGRAARWQLESAAQTPLRGRKKKLRLLRKPCSSTLVPSNSHKIAVSFIGEQMLERGGHDAPAWCRGRVRAKLER